MKAQTVLDTTWVLEALKKGELDFEGQFLNSSNYTFLMRISYQAQEFKTVYKPVKGERPLWDFPEDTLAKREVAAYLVSRALDWKLVPPTILRKKAPLGPGSLQQYIDHDPEYHFFTFSPEDRQLLRPVVVFDILVNNADRKGSHLFFDTQRRLWLIDHGICFHREDKLRTVLWDFGGEPIPEDLLQKIEKILEQLRNKGKIYRRLLRLLSVEEVDAMAERAASLVREGHFPFPGTHHRPYPWPPI